MEKLSFITAAVTEQHQRRQNEDSCDYRWVNGCGCWVMADGLGGHQGGEVASRLAVESIIAAFAGQPEISAEAVTRYLQAGQQALLSRQQEEPRLSGMRTTIVLLLADQQAARWGHAGDSRLYHFRGGRIINQTKDHSVAQSLANAGEIKPEEVRGHEDRHRLLRALGQDDDFRPTISKDPTTPGTGRCLLAVHRRFLGTGPGNRNGRGFEPRRHPQAWLEKMQSRITERTLNEADKKHDNFTAMAILANHSS